MPILNYTTDVPVTRTIAEMEARLLAYGASSIRRDFDDGRPIALHFVITTPAGRQAFRLPVNIPGVRSAIERDATDRPSLRRYLRPDQVQRITWRIAKDWLEAQLAIVDAHMASVDEIMLPYLIVPGGKTLYQAFTEQRALPEGRSER